MCNQIPSVNLQTAVLMQVQEFVNSGQTFSRYDITKALRQKCNDGLLEIPEIEDTNPGATNRFNVRKSEVDAIFEQLYQNCLANGLPPLNYHYNPNLGYRVFSADPNFGLTTPAQTPASTQVPTSLPTAVTLPPINPNRVVSAPAPSAKRTIQLDMAELIRRINLYLINCNKIGKKPTLRQIQSAIKRRDRSTGLSRRECKNIAISLGYQL